MTARQPLRTRRQRGLIGGLVARAKLDWYRVQRAEAGAHVIAGGTAVGMFWAFSPFMGVQMVLALISAQALKVSRVTALAAVWLSNPLTAVPIYGFNYLVGTIFTPANVDSPLRHPNLLVSDGWGAIGSLDWMDLFTLWLGSTIVGLVAAWVSYGVAYRSTERFMAKRLRRRLKRQQREVLRAERKAVRAARAADRAASRAEQQAQVALTAAERAGMRAERARAVARRAARTADDLRVPLHHFRGNDDDYPESAAADGEADTEREVGGG